MTLQFKKTPLKLIPEKLVPQVVALTSPGNANGLLNPKEAAAFLTVSTSMLARDRWFARRAGVKPQFPFLKIGASVRYRLADLQKILEAGQVG